MAARWLTAEDVEWNVERRVFNVLIDLQDTVLVRTAGLGGVQIDGDAGRARIGAALWGEVVPAASDQGFAPLHDSSPTVGIADYTLGGGASFYGRKHGLACTG